MPFRDDPYQKILENYQLKAKELPQVSDDDLENVKQKQQYSTLANAVSQLVSSAGSFQGQQAKPMDFTQISDSAAQDLALKQQKTKLARDALNLDYNKEFETQRAADAKLSSERSAARQAEMDMFTRAKLTQDLQKGSLSVGQKKLDEDFAKEYNEWTSGYRSEAEKNLALLRKSAEVLKKSKLVSGRAYGIIPNALQPEIAKIVMQDVQSAAQASLKAILGTQFTEKEGERIMRTSFDPQLSEEANLDKVMRTIKELEERMANKNAKARIFESEGSLRNYRMIYNYPDPEPDEKKTSPTAGGETKVINGKTYKKVKGGWEET